MVSVCCCILRRHRAASPASALLLFAALAAMQLPQEASAEPGRRPPLDAFQSLSIFHKQFNPKKSLEVQVIEPDASDGSAAPALKPAPQGSKGDDRLPEWFQRAGLRYNGEPTDILPPQENPSVRINPDAPEPIKAMIAAKRLGDRELAKDYARQFVRYQQNFFFELRDVVELIGQALIEQQVIDEDSWVGVGQFMEHELAKTRFEVGAVLKPTHDAAMRRIAADPKHEVEVLWFFTLNCSWCRYMAPDVERLWELLRDDPKVKMTALTLGPTPAAWVEEYRRYTGLSAPILDGGPAARELNIAFAPAVVVVAPNVNRAYVKTGQQSFERMYEFVRTAQGLPAVISRRYLELASTPIGEVEKAAQATLGRQAGVIQPAGSRGPGAAEKAEEKGMEMQRF